MKLAIVILNYVHLALLVIVSSFFIYLSFFDLFVKEKLDKVIHSRIFTQIPVQSVLKIIAWTGYYCYPKVVYRFAVLLLSKISLSICSVGCQNQEGRYCKIVLYRTNFIIIIIIIIVNSLFDIWLCKTSFIRIKIISLLLLLFIIVVVVVVIIIIIVSIITTTTFWSGKSPNSIH